MISASEAHRRDPPRRQVDSPPLSPSPEASRGTMGGIVAAATAVI
jgi:hypothetical protein